MKSILELSHTEAREYFLKQESYCSVDLPKYFDFQPLLNAISQNNSIRGGLSGLDNAKKLDDVNYKFLTNKDGKYAWRPLQLINPAIYVYLVQKITEQNNWELIVNRFKKFQQFEQINCCSIPVVSTENTTTNKAKSITNWWQQIEQQSLELALKYDCFMNTDITDCYGSVYTHSITWALRGKKIAKNSSSDSHIANTIDKTIQSMQYAQTNGIPQGSTLMDFIAEMVLGYADRILYYKIKYYNHKEQRTKIEDFQILRYRDDYRIFATNEETLVKIAKLLTETLIDLNFKINTQKTTISKNIVRDVIKPDKLYWNAAKRDANTLQRHLFLIHSLAEKYPNSGSLSIALTKFLDRIYPIKLFKESNTKVLVSILVDIAYNNPKTYPVATIILGKILSLETDSKIIDEILNSIDKKFSKIPNVGHLQVWLQRLTIKTNSNKDFNEKLCKKVLDDNVQIWNNSWLNQTISNLFNQNPIIDQQKIIEMPDIPEPQEVKIFNYTY